MLLLSEPYSANSMEAELLSDWSAVGHLAGAGEGGAERPDLW